MLLNILFVAVCYGVLAFLGKRAIDDIAEM
jgi:hypothetical protein